MASSGHAGTVIVNNNNKIGSRNINPSSGGANTEENISKNGEL